MIIVNSVYPCTACKEEIDPRNAFCPHCGEKQPELTGRVFYNLIVRRGLDGPFNMKYGGIILTKEDIEDLLNQDPAPLSYQCFVIAYIPAENIPGDTLKVQSMFIASGQLVSDFNMGPQLIKITHLE